MAQESALSALLIDSGFSDFNLLTEARWVEEGDLPQFFFHSNGLMAFLMYDYALASGRPAAEIDEIAPSSMSLIHCETNSKGRIIHLQHIRPLCYPQCASRGSVSDFTGVG